MTSKVIIAVGISGSGKSHFAKELIAKDKSWVEISRDEIRRDLFKVEGWSSYIPSRENEKLVTAEQYTRYKKALSENKNIIITDTNIRTYYVNGHVNYFKKMKCKVYIKIFNITLVEIMRRYEERSDKVDTEKLIKQLSLFKKTKNNISIKYSDLIIEDPCNV